MTFWVRFLEISGNFHHRRSLFMTSFHYIFTTFSSRFHHIYTTIYTTWNFHDIFSLHFHYKFSPQRDEQTGTNRLHGDTQTDFHYIFTPQIYTTHFHHRFSPRIFTTNFHDHSENSDFHDIFTTPVVKIQIFTTFSWHGLDLIFFPPIFHNNRDFHDIFTTPIVKIQIFMTFSPRP